MPDLAARAEEHAPQKLGDAGLQVNKLRAELSSQIALHLESLRGKPIDSLAVFSGSSLAGFENGSTARSVQFNSFINHKSDIFEGADARTASWLLAHREMLQSKGIVVHVSVNEQQKPTGRYVLHSISPSPEVLTEQQRLQLINHLNIASNALSGGDLEKAYMLVHPVIKYLEATSILNGQVPMPKTTRSNLIRIAAEAYTDIEKGSLEKAAEKLNAITSFISLGFAIKNFPEPGTSSRDLDSASRYKSFMVEMSKAIGSMEQLILNGEFTQASALSSVAIIRIQREHEISTAKRYANQLPKTNIYLNVTKLPVFQEKDDSGQLAFNPKRFEELTGVSYADYRNGTKDKKQRGIGLLLSARLDMAIAAADASVKELEKALEAIRTGSGDPTAEIRQSMARYSEFQRSLASLSGMVGTAASVVKLRKQDTVLSKLDFTSGKMALAGEAARGDLQFQLDFTRSKLGEATSYLQHAFFQFAVGNTFLGKRIVATKVNNAVISFKDESRKLNLLFSVAKQFETTLGMMEAEAKFLANHAIPQVGTALGEIGRMYDSAAAKDIKKRLESIEKLSEARTAVHSPAAAILDKAVDSLWDARSNLRTNRNESAEAYRWLLANYHPDQISGKSTPDQNPLADLSFDDRKVQKAWEGYLSMYAQGVGHAHMLISGLPAMLTSRYSSIQQIQNQVAAQEQKLMAQVEAIREKKIVAVAVGVGVGSIVTIGTLGTGTGVGIGAGSATTAWIMGSLAVGGGALAGVGSGMAYLQWKTAEIQGAEKNEIDQYRNQFYQQLALSGVMAVAGFAGAGVRAIQAGTATRLVTSIGLNALRVADYASLGSLSLDGTYAAYKYASTGSYGMAALSGGMAALPFAIKGISVLARSSVPKRAAAVDIKPDTLPDTNELPIGRGRRMVRPSPEIDIGAREGPLRVEAPKPQAGSGRLDSAVAKNPVPAQDIHGQNAFASINQAKPMPRAAPDQAVPAVQQAAPAENILFDNLLADLDKVKGPERGAVLDRVFSLTPQEQGRFVQHLYRSGEFNLADQVGELMTLNALEHSTGMVRGTLTPLYLNAAHGFEADIPILRALEDRLGISIDLFDAGLAKQSRVFYNFFGMVGSGKLLNFAAAIAPKGSTLANIVYHDGAMGAYELRFVNPQGGYISYFAKAQSLSPDKLGSNLLRRAGVVAPEVSVGMHGSAFEFINPDGLVTKYGIIQSIRNFEGPLTVGGREIKVETVAASSFSNVDSLFKNPNLATLRDFAVAKPDAFNSLLYNEIGYAEAATSALAVGDRHAGNVWITALAIPESEVNFVQGTGRRVFRDGSDRPFFLSVGAIDTDSVAHYQVIRKGSMKEAPMDFAHHIDERVDSLSKIFRRGLYNTGVPSNEVDLKMAGFFNQHLPDLQQGTERWMNEIGRNPRFKITVAGGVNQHIGSSIGIGRHVNSADFIASDGTPKNIFVSEPFNGQTTRRIDQYGRTVLDQEAARGARDAFGQMLELFTDTRDYWKEIGVRMQQISNKATAVRKAAAP